MATEKSHELEERSTQLRDEQQKRKQFEKQANELQETNTELTAAKDSAETVHDITRVPTPPGKSWIFFFKI